MSTGLDAIKAAIGARDAERKALEAAVIRLRRLRAGLLDEELKIASVDEREQFITDLESEIKEMEDELAEGERLIKTLRDEGGPAKAEPVPESAMGFDFSIDPKEARFDELASRITIPERKVEYLAALNLARFGTPSAAERNRFANLFTYLSGEYPEKVTTAAAMEEFPVERVEASVARSHMSSTADVERVARQAALEAVSSSARDVYIEHQFTTFRGTRDTLTRDITDRLHMMLRKRTFGSADANEIEFETFTSSISELVIEYGLSTLGILRCFKLTTVSMANVLTNQALEEYHKDKDSVNIEGLLESFRSQAFYTLSKSDARQNLLRLRVRTRYQKTIGVVQFVFQNIRVIFEGSSLKVQMCAAIDELADYFKTIFGKPNALGTLAFTIKAGPDDEKLTTLYGKLVDAVRLHYPPEIPDKYWEGSNHKPETPRPVHLYENPAYAGITGPVQYMYPVPNFQVPANHDGGATWMPYPAANVAGMSVAPAQPQQQQQQDFSQGQTQQQGNGQGKNGNGNRQRGKNRNGSQVSNVQTHANSQGQGGGQGQQSGHNGGGNGQRSNNGQQGNMGNGGNRGGNGYVSNRPVSHSGCHKCGGEHQRINCTQFAENADFRTRKSCCGNFHGSAQCFAIKAQAGFGIPNGGHLPEHSRNAPTNQPATQTANNGGNTNATMGGQVSSIQVQPAASSNSLQ